MNKPKKQIDKRAEYIKQRIKETKNTSNEITKLANELFLSERTIERDLKRR